MTLMHSKPDVPPESSTSPQSSKDSSKVDKKETAPEVEPAAVAVEAEKKEVAKEGVSHNLISFETPEAEFVYFFVVIENKIVKTEFLFSLNIHKTKFQVFNICIFK